MLCRTDVTVAVLIVVLLADLSSAQGRSRRSIYEYEQISIHDIYHGFWHYALLNILAIAFSFCRSHCQLMAKNYVLPNVIATLSTVCLANDVPTR